MTGLPNTSLPKAQGAQAGLGPVIQVNWQLDETSTDKLVFKQYGH